MRKWDTIAIVGVGLIGGSIGLALKRRNLARCVVGVGRRQASLRVAKRKGAVDHTTVDLSRGVRDAELTVVCTPVERVVEDVQRVAEACPPEGLVTDAGSSKNQIVTALDGQLPRGVRFVGSHPLAGSENSGPQAASASLYENHVVVVTPTRTTPQKDFDEVAEFWQALGAEVVRLTPAYHDRALAATSHLPHLAAAALAAAVPRQFWPLSGGGLRDTTRVAAADPQLWQQILLSNRDNVLASLAALEGHIGALRTALEDADAAKLERILKKAKKHRDALGS